MAHGQTDQNTGDSATLWKAGAGRNGADDAEAVLETVRALYAELHREQLPVESIDLASRLERDLGFDSLARVELVRRLEDRFGLRLSDEALSSVETAGDLLRACRAGSVSRAHLPQGRAREAVPPGRRTAGSFAGRTDTPSAARTLDEMLDWRVQRQADTIHAVVLENDVPTELTYGGLRQGARLVAGGLARAGLQAGARVALMLPTGIGYLHAFFGVLLAGAIPVPIYPPTRLSQLEEHVGRHAGILQSAGAAALITFPQTETVARLLSSMVPSLEHVLSLEDLRPGAGFWSARRAAAAESTALLQYTSGSTGDPKGVILTHADILANIRAIGRTVRATEADTFVSWLPLYHDMGLIGAWLGSLYFGCLLVLLPPTAFLTRPGRWLRAIHDYRATLSASPNFGYELCVTHTRDEELRDLDLSSWRIAFNGAEPVRPETLDRFARRFARFGFRAQAMTPVYGLAEAALGVAFSPPGRGPRIDVIDRREMMAAGRALAVPEAQADALRFVSCGSALPGYHMRILGPEGSEEPERVEGAIQFSGPSATRGYYRDEGATARLRHGEWLDTGDRGYMADGELFVTGRAKDLIIRRGRHIYPEEIEHAVGALEGIRKGCVVAFGARDPAGATERLILVAETHHTEPRRRLELRTRINRRVVDIIGEPPEEILLVPAHSVLKTSSGKLRRAATRAAYEAGSLGRGAFHPALQRLRLTTRASVPFLRKSWRRTVRAVYGWYAWLVVAVIGVPAGLLALLLSRRRAWNVTHLAAKWVIRACGISFSVSALPDIDSGPPHLIVANHASYVDSVFLVALFARPHRFIAKGELARAPLLGAWLRKLGTVFIDRSAPLEGAIERIRVSLDSQADSLAVFPEGTFTNLTGLAPFHMGAFQLAAATGMAVVPVALRGTRSVLRDGQRLLRRSPVRATVGSPVAIFPGEDSFAAAVRLRDAARSHILRYCGEPDLS